MEGVGMKVLITGHQGYIGTVLVPLLLEKGHEVIGVDSELFSGCVFGNYTSPIRSIKKDIRDVQLSDVQGCDAMIHLAGLSNDPLGDLNPEITMEINHEAAVRLAQLAKKASVQRFLFSSSCSNYGATGERTNNEESAFFPVTPYGRSKVRVEHEVSKLADESFSPTFLRSATAYGVSPLLRFDLVLNNLVAWAFTTGKIYLKSDGTPWRPIVHVEDIARAFVTVLEAPKELISNEAFNVGSNEENYRVCQLAEIVKNVVPDSHIIYAPDAGPDKRCYRVDCSKIARVLNFTPKWNARRGAQQLLDAYKQIGLQQHEFEGVRYKRISHIQHLLESGRLDTTLRWRSA